MLFHIIPEAQAILRNNGVYRQVKVFRRRHRGEDRDRIFVAYGGGFVYVMRNGTSVSKLHCEDVMLPFDTEYDSLGRIVVPTSYQPTEESSERKESKKNASRSA